jgi:hypothetical protein
MKARPPGAATMSPSAERIRVVDPASVARKQMTDLHTLTYGERDGTRSERIERIEAQMEGVRFQPRAPGRRRTRDPTRRDGAGR